MTLITRGNLAHNRRPERSGRARPRVRRKWRAAALACGAAAGIACGALAAWAAPTSVESAPARTAPGAPEAPSPPPPRPPEILAPPMPPDPAQGKGRLALVIGGSRRWCTYPDDRLVKPPVKPGSPLKRNEVYTFGYKFGVSAVKRGQADTPLVLFESPLFRTATWLPAYKLGQSRKTGPGGPIIGVEGEALPRMKEIPKGPATLVPRWDEIYRCVTLPERLDFDLDPGTYDVYIAFDLLNREGGWVHRMTGHLTDVPVEAARRTRLDGIVGVAAGAERQVELLSATIEPPAGAAGASGP